MLKDSNSPYNDTIKTLPFGEVLYFYAGLPLCERRKTRLLIFPVNHSTIG